jgi:hypothetical protein
MCTFNGERFLNAQLESIASQIRLPDELVICDDRSSDSSCEIIRSFIRRVAFPVRFVINETNLGSTKNFEQAIALCHGTVVALADQDDVWYAHKLENIEKAFLRSSDIALAFSDADLIDANSQLLGKRLWSAFCFDSAKQRQFANGHALNVLMKHPVVTGATMAFRRESFNLIAPIPSNDIHDRWISFLLAAHGQCGIIPQPLMKYRQHAHQQEGLVPVKLPERMAFARGRGADIYHEEIERLQQLSTRLAQRCAAIPQIEDVQKEFEGKILHLQHRARLPRSRFARGSKILREIMNGNYWRYAGGWISIAKDLFIRE